MADDGDPQGRLRPNGAGEKPISSGGSAVDENAVGEKAAKRQRPQRAARARAFLACHLVCNALLIAYVAINHTFTAQLPVESGWDAILRQHQTFIEALLLTLPGWILGAAVAKFLPRLGALLGAILITLTPVLYYADLTSYLIIGQRLFSRQTSEIVFSIHPWLSDFTTLTSYSRVVWAGVIWAVVEVLSLFVATWISRHVSFGKATRWKLLLAAAALVVLLTPLGFRLAKPRAVLDEMRRHSDRHPICASALVGQPSHAAPEGPNIEEIRIRTHLLKHRAAANDYKARYFNVAATGKPKRPLDVVLVICESFRHDALSEKSSPNLWELRKKSITSRLHFPGGNTSYVAFQVALFGFDPAFSVFDTGDWPPALLNILHQAGYYRAFVGTGGFWREMDRFLNSINFEFYRLDMTFPYNERDRKVVEQAVQILDREGPFRELKGTPVFAMLYLHSTHYSYHSAEEDRVFTPAAPDPLLAPPWDGEYLQKVKNRYLNSVHAVDRLVAPLFAPNRIVIITGDHGETFHEDGRFIHGSALSYPQTTTPFVLYVPDAPPTELAGPTSHADILPTLLDALGIPVNDPALFAGRSLVDPEQRARPTVFSLRDLTTKTCALRGPYCNRQGATRLFHFSIDVWEPSFAFAGVFDEMARPVAAREGDAAAFTDDMEIWLDRLLGGSIGPIAEDPVPDLIDLLQNAEIPTQHRVLEILRELGPKAKAAIPALESHLSADRPWEIRKDAAETLVAVQKGP